MKPFDYELIIGSDGHPEFRVRHVATDSRIATCFEPSNAELIVAALNAFTRQPTLNGSDPDFVGIVEPHKPGGGA